jgi:sodium/proline symporter
MVIYIIIFKYGGIFAIYELLPAFIFSSICIVALSLLTAPSSKEIEEDLESVKLNLII